MPPGHSDLKHCSHQRKKSRTNYLKLSNLRNAPCPKRGVRRYTQGMKFTPHFKTLAAAVFCITFAAVASAQWQWIGKDGRKVFSDQSPPPEIQEKDILKRPGGARLPAANTPVAAADTATPGKPTTAASAPGAKASAPKISGKDSELEARKKKADEEEAAKKKAEADKVTAAKADNCTRAKSGLTTLQSGIRMSSVNAKGERIVMDDSARALETKRAQEVIDSSCN